MFKKLSLKAWIIIALCVVILLTVFLACLITATLKDEHIFQYKLNADRNSYSIVDIKSTYRGGWFARKTITVPSTHRGKPVTVIQQIKDLQQTDTVVIPDSVTELGASAFYGSNITYIKVPDSVKKIGTSAFENCVKLTDVQLPSKLTTISGGMFRSCFSLANITLPESVLTIGKGAFANCYALESIELPSKVTSIDQETFADCYGLTSIELPSRLNAIGENAFRSCYSLVEICNNSSLTIEVGNDRAHGQIAHYALNVYSDTDGESHLNYTEAGDTFYVDGAKVLYVKHYGVDTKLTLPSKFNGVNYTIHDYAFYGDRNIEEVTIPDGVTEIGYDAFENCRALRKVSIGDNVTIVKEYAFQNCQKLTDVHFGSAIQTIESKAFYECMALDKIVLPDSLEVIGNEAFAECGLLKDITIGKGIRQIGDKAFYNDIRFTELKFGGTVAQWNQVQLGSQWSWDNNYTKNAPSCEKVICSDGEVVIAA